MELGLRDANQRFSSMIRAVRAGQDVVLTDRGVPLAVIRRVGEEDSDQRLAALVAEGLVTPAERPQPMPAPRWKPELLSGPSIADAIGADRDETA